MQAQIEFWTNAQTRHTKMAIQLAATPNTDQTEIEYHRTRISVCRSKLAELES